MLGVVQQDFSRPLEEDTLEQVVSLGFSGGEQNEVWTLAAELRAV